MQNAPRRRGRPPKVQARAERGYGYRLRRVGPKGFASLTVPRVLADQVPAQTRFMPELTEEGILFRPIEKPEQNSINAPAWTRH